MFLRLICLFGAFSQVSSVRNPQSAPTNHQEVTGIGSAFLRRHSQDGALLERLQASAGVSSMASIINLVEPNKATCMLYMIYCNNINILGKRKTDSEFKTEPTVSVCW